MTFTGWIFMLCSVGFVVGLACFCYYRVLTAPPAEPPPAHTGCPPPKSDP